MLNMHLKYWGQIGRNNMPSSGCHTVYQILAACIPPPSAPNESMTLRTCTVAGRVAALPTSVQAALRHFKLQDGVN